MITVNMAKYPFFSYSLSLPTIVQNGNFGIFPISTDFGPILDRFSPLLCGVCTRVKWCQIFSTFQRK